MLKSILDAVMERRAGQLMEQVGGWLPSDGPVLDLGSGTGHLSARLEQELGLEVVTAGSGATASWTPAPEKGITGYVVTWGPPDNPAQHTLRVVQPKAALAGAGPGTIVRVKAVNAKGMEGWDWARATTRPLP